MHPICLECGRKIPIPLGRQEGQFLCQCGNVIPYKHGIYIFTNQDEFYEGRFTATHGLGIRGSIKNLLSYISINGSAKRHFRKAMRHVEKNVEVGELEILNVGSGGGDSFLKSFGTVNSLDISLKSLINALDVSDYCYQADCTRLPFEDCSFDLVFSSQFLGHVPLSQKQKAIDEIFRVTKHRGYSVHDIECEANNFIFRIARRHPDLYNEYFKEMYGHYGIESPSECMRKFRKAGFTPIIERPDYCMGIVRPVNSYKIWFGEKGYYQKHILLKFLKTISQILSFNTPIRTLANVIIYPFVIFNVFLGKDGVDSVKLLYRK